MNIRKYIWAYVVAMALICPGVKAQEQITIGVIQYDVRDIDKSFKALHEQGFGSCELNYSEKRFTKELAEQVKAASEKHRIRVTTLVGVPGSKSILTQPLVWRFRLVDWWTVLFVLLCGAALAMLIWKRREENDPEEIDEENMEDFAE